MRSTWREYAIATAFASAGRAVGAGSPQPLRAEADHVRRAEFVLVVSRELAEQDHLDELVGPAPSIGLAASVAARPASSVCFSGCDSWPRPGHYQRADGCRSA